MMNKPEMKMQIRNGKIGLTVICLLFVVLWTRLDTAAFAAESWVQQARLTASDPQDYHKFGLSVAVDGDTVIVGTYGEEYGSVADRSSGAAYVFVKGTEGWSDMTQVAKLTASDGEPGESDYFGKYVAISGDTAVVGSLTGDTVYVFVKPSGGWHDMTETARLTASNLLDLSTFSLAIDHDTIIVGDAFDDIDGYIRVGSAYIFEKPAIGWHNMTETARLTLSNPNPFGGDNFGVSVSISGDTAVVIKSENFYPEEQGAAYVFEKPVTGWHDMTTDNAAKLTASDAASHDYFGGTTGGAPGRYVASAEILS